MPDNLPVGNASSRHLLIVDDEESILLALRRMLRRDGYVIHMAGSGAEGLEILAREPIGVVLTDQRMPGMTGAEFLARVKELYPDTIRIALSGYTELASITEAINRGAIYKFLTKPWDDDLLRGHIAEAFARFEMKADNERLAALNQAIVDAVPDALFLVDSRTAQVVTANAAAATLLGYPLDAFPGMPVSTFEPLPQDQCYWEEIAGGGFIPMHGAETEFLSADGRWLSVRKTTSSASNGVNRNVLVLAHNLQHVRAMESSLERVNAELAAIFEATSEGLLVLDSERRLIRMNRRLDGIWQFPAVVLASGSGTALLEWIAGCSVDPDETLEVFAAHFDQPDIGSSGTITCRDGAIVHWYANPQLLGDEIIGNVLGFAAYHAPEVWGPQSGG